MNEIVLLSQDTIDKIAAGEVVERPASVVKELVENAVDAGANAITVEIRDGGTTLVRITDNGCGIPKEQVRIAYLQHATSKIRKVEDLLTSGTLGFRGEALSSIAAVSQVEMITKTAGSLTGVRYVIEGGTEKSFEEIGAPEGTTFLVHNLFYNTPARKKFLKSASSEAGYVSDLLERMALSHPNISFKFISNRDTKLHTSGNCNLKDIIYGIYGRDIAANLLKVEADYGNIRIHGFLGKPVISRGNRNYENYFVNGRYVKSTIVARAIEDAYKAFMMSRRYPFTVLLIEVDTEEVDVNVHPQKLEVRFANQQEIYEKVLQTVKEALLGKELIPEFTIDGPKQRSGADQGAAGGTGSGKTLAENGSTGQSAGGAMHVSSGSNTAGRRTDTMQQGVERPADSAPLRYPEPFEKIRSQLIAEANSPYEIKYPHRDRRGGTMMKPVTGSVVGGQSRELQAESADSAAGAAAGATPQPNTSESAGRTSTSGHIEKINPQSSVTQVLVSGREECSAVSKHTEGGKSQSGGTQANATEREKSPSADSPAARALAEDIARMQQEQEARRGVQMELFEHRLLTEESRRRHRLIGQVFDTYWIVEFEDKLYIIDQHAAHEKVMYERFMKQYGEKRQTSQMITPPVIVTLSMQEETLLKRHLEEFRAVGFEIEPFGGREYAIGAVPDNLYGLASRELFLEILDGLSDVSEHASNEIVLEKIASMSCKAAVKGNNRLSTAEADALIGELLTLENPYNCPHGRPTIIAMTKYELEKKFKRVL